MGDVLEAIQAALQEDPFNLSRKHNIKKLIDVKDGEGQWRIRSGVSIASATMYTVARFWTGYQPVLRILRSGPMLSVLPLQIPVRVRVSRQCLGFSVEFQRSARARHDVRQVRV